MPLFFQPASQIKSFKILIASSAAFFPLSMPTVATGVPGGICTIDNRASRPFNLLLTGTPITGISVFEAIIPGSAAPSPAIAIITYNPSFLRYSSRRSGSLCADITWRS